MRKPLWLTLLLLLVSTHALAQSPSEQTQRANAARQRRVVAIDFQHNQPLPTLEDNDDEETYADQNYFASYSKGLQHDSLGEPSPTEYVTLRNAAESGNPSQFEGIILGGERKLVNPQAGFAFVLEGADPWAITLRPAPRFTSDEVAGEMDELYWMSLLRDVRFDQYASNSTAVQAAQELTQRREYRGARASDGQVTPATLFRADTTGAIPGPFISQLLYKPVPYGGGPLAITLEQNPPPASADPTGIQVIDQRNLTRLSGDDRVTAYNEWLSIQDGELPADPTDTLEDFDAVRRYIRNGRDLAEWVHFDYPIQSSLNAALLLARQGDFLSNGVYEPDPKSSPLAHDLNNPYRNYLKQEAFITFGNSEAQTLTALVTNTVLRGQWFQKWVVHRRLRPEEYGGRVHNTVTGAKAYPVPAELLSSPVLPLILARNAQRNAERGLGSAGTYLLSQAFPEGSPMHPAYGSGHSTYIGAGVTIIKAFYGDFPLRNPQVPNADGTALVAYNGTLMFFDELDKLASNIGVARLFAGVHYRSDHDHAVRLGELHALRTLQDWARLYNEPFDGFQVRTLGGNTLTVTASHPGLPNHVSAVNGFTLVDANTDQDIGPLYNGMTIDLSDLAPGGNISQLALNVRANTYPATVGSVRLVFDGTARVENAAPYALGGDSGGNYAAFSPLKTVGVHVLTATPFSDPGAGELGGVPLTIRFTVQQ